MCGICGVWGSIDRASLDAMVMAMYHRGPDDSGVYVDERVSLGMTRLAIIDLSPAGHQPMSNPEQTIWIVFNGEIFNFKEKRTHLEKLGYQFASASDTEVILRLYEHYGDDFSQHLRGMFALAVYDLRRGKGRERLLLVRDHLGIKPLLFAEVDNRFVFASEIKSLLASGVVAREIDPEALRLLLTFGSVNQPRTILRGVQMLLPGHRLIVEGGSCRIERYWSLGVGRQRAIGTLPYEEQVEVVREALRASVLLQMVSDVPIGAFLSGGVDSSITVAMMSALAGHRIKTFSVGFEQEGNQIDETEDARKTAHFLGTHHHHVIVRGEDVRDHILHIASGLDQPTVDGVNSYFVSWAARQHVTVSISGTGGDELFAGYPWFLNMVRESQAPPKRIKNLTAAIARLRIFDPFMATRWNSRLYRVRTSAGFLSRFSMQYFIFGSIGASTLLAPGFRNQTNLGRAEAFDLSMIDELSDASVLERVTALCLRGYTANQLLRDMDAASMAHSLEVRVPYLDRELTDLVLSLPDHTKLYPPQFENEAFPANTYRALGVKRILIDAGKPFLPEGFDIQPKRGFSMPFDSWLRGPLREVMMETLSEPTITRRGWFSSTSVQNVVKEFEAQSIGWACPWLLMITELWAREVLDKKQ